MMTEKQSSLSNSVNVDELKLKIFKRHKKGFHYESENPF